MKRNRHSKTAFLIAILAYFSAYAFNEWNLATLTTAAPEKVRAGVLLTSADDFSYLNPAENFVNSGEWKDESIGLRSYFLRTPGYGMIYSTTYRFFGEAVGLRYLKYIQLLLFAWSVYSLFNLSMLVSKNKVVSITIGLCYGVFPIALGFVYYTLTEAVTPALIIIYANQLANAYYRKERSRRHFLYASIALALIIIVRPALMVFGLALPLLIYEVYKLKRYRAIVTYFIIYGSISFSLLGAWEIRNYQIAGEYVGLHPIYHPSSNTIFRPVHERIWEFSRSAGMTGTTFHQRIEAIWQACVRNNCQEKNIAAFISSLPSDALGALEEEKILAAFDLYLKTIEEQRNYLIQSVAMPSELSENELTAIRAFQELNQQLISTNWMVVYIYNPLKELKNIIFHSNLNLYIFQDTYRGVILMEILRWTSFILHAMSMISLLLSILFIRNINLLSSVNICAVLYIAILIFRFGGLEERYTLPLLPIALINLFVLVPTIKQFYTSTLSK